MTITSNKIIGDRGEILAKEYLQRHDYRIVGTNYRSGHLEIDLIAKKNNQLIFFEIKTRIKTADSLKENPLTKWQIANLKRAIGDYCYKNRINFDAVHLDLIIILVDRDKKKAELKHYRDIF